MYMYTLMKYKNNMHLNTTALQDTRLRQCKQLRNKHYAYHFVLNPVLDLPYVYRDDTIHPGMFTNWPLVFLAGLHAKN